MSFDINHESEADPTKSSREEPKRQTMLTVSSNNGYDHDLRGLRLGDSLSVYDNDDTLLFRLDLDQITGNKVINLLGGRFIVYTRS